MAGLLDFIGDPNNPNAAFMGLLGASGAMAPYLGAQRLPMGMAPALAAGGGGYEQGIGQGVRNQFVGAQTGLVNTQTQNASLDALLKLMQTNWQLEGAGVPTIPTPANITRTLYGNQGPTPVTSQGLLSGQQPTSADGDQPAQTGDTTATPVPGAGSGVGAGLSQHIAEVARLNNMPLRQAQMVFLTDKKAWQSLIENAYKPMETKPANAVYTAAGGFNQNPFRSGTTYIDQGGNLQVLPNAQGIEANQKYLNSQAEVPAAIRIKGSIPGVAGLAGPTDTYYSAPGSGGGGRVIPGAAPWMQPPPGAPNAPGPSGPSQSSSNPRGLPVGLSPMVLNRNAEDNKYVSELRVKADQAQEDMGLSRNMLNLASQVKTGWSADARNSASQIMAAFGVDKADIDKWMGMDPAKGQELQKIFVQLSSHAARQMGAREPGSVIAMFQGAYPNLETRPDAIQFMGNVIYMNAKRIADMGGAADKYLNESVQTSRGNNYRGLTGFADTFNKTASAEHYLNAAEAMSGIKPARDQITINLIPSGQAFMAPNGKMKVKP